LHGASDWENGKVTEVIARGICCFNVDTATRLAFVNSLVKAVHEQNEISFDIRRLLGDARDAVKNVVKEKIRYYGGEGKVEIPDMTTECVTGETNLWGKNKIDLDNNEE